MCNVVVCSILSVEVHNCNLINTRLLYERQHL